MNLNLNMKKFLSNPIKCSPSSSCPERSSGFTLLELLIVVSIIAILSVALIIVLNPAETLRKSRDSQRMSDLATMKTALGLYLTSTSTPYLAATSTNTGCETTIGQPIKTWYSAVGASTTAPTSIAVATLTDGTGWIPVNFDSLTGGSPISNLPLDPTNTVFTINSPIPTDLVYRYSCSTTPLPLAFEIDAALESTAFASSTWSDGGNNTNLYEVGTNLKILPATGNF